MTSMPDIRLDHINLLANNPEWLTDWYAENFGFQAKDGFVFGPGTLLVFEKGKLLDDKGNVHFGFRYDERDSVVSWTNKFNATLEQDELYCDFKTENPEGNVFEVYRE